MVALGERAPLFPKPFPARSLPTGMGRAWGTIPSWLPVPRQVCCLFFQAAAVPPAGQTGQDFPTESPETTTWTGNDLVEISPVPHIEVDSPSNRCHGSLSSEPFIEPDSQQRITAGNRHVARAFAVSPARPDAGRYPARRFPIKVVTHGIPSFASQISFPSRIGRTTRLRPLIAGLQARREELPASAAHEAGRGCWLP